MPDKYHLTMNTVADHCLIFRTQYSYLTHTNNLGYHFYYLTASNLILFRLIKNNNENYKHSSDRDVLEDR